MSENMKPAEKKEYIPFITGLWTFSKKVGTSLKMWSWARKLLFWLIISAGTLSELVFLLASLWVSINANVHLFLVDTLGMSQHLTESLTYIATTAFVALPECIVGLAALTTIGHIRTIAYNPKVFWPWLWATLYGIPALFFLVLSMITLGNAVNDIHFIMPAFWVVCRALAAFSYAFTSLLYVWLGEEQERDRLVEKDQKLATTEAQKDGKISELAGEIQFLKEQLEKETVRLNQIITEQNAVINREKTEKASLVKAINENAESALEAYSEECVRWLRSGVKSVKVEEITRFTGHSNRKVNAANRAGKFKHPGRNQELITIDSLVKWLIENPVNSDNDQDENGTLLRLVNS